MAHGIAHQRPALSAQTRAGDGNDRRHQHGVDHKGKLERFKQRAQHEASLAAATAGEQAVLRRENKSG